MDPDGELAMDVAPLVFSVFRPQVVGLVEHAPSDDRPALVPPLLLPIRLGRDGRRSVLAFQAATAKAILAGLGAGNRQHGRRRCAYLDRCSLRPARVWADAGLDGAGRAHSPPSLRAVPLGCAGLADPRRQRRADHAVSSAVDVAKRVLGTALEPGLPVSFAHIRLSASSASDRLGGSDGRGVSSLRGHSRPGNLAAGSRRLFVANGLFCDPGGRSVDRAFRPRQAAAAGCGMERPGFHAGRYSRSSRALVSRAVHQQRSCANVAFDRGVLACGV